MSAFNDEQKWVPTHVQVTVLRGRGLRGKGKHGTSDVYTIIQLGKEKYSTGVAEKTTEPEWREECSFELQPGALESGGLQGELVLTAMHRSLIGLDVFLGQALIRLDKVFGERRGVKNEWYRLNSKTGKKEKERGDIQVTVQFTRNNLTASMYDLVMKDKSISTFSKLKERMRGKRRSSEEDSSSAVLPGGYGSLYRMRQRLPSDGGGEEDYEDDEGGEARRSKMRTFFLRGKLRKSSDTRSSTSLGSESSESSSRGGSLSPTAGISVVVSDLSNSPSNSSNLTVDNSPEHTADISPKSPSLRCEFGDDEPGELIIPVPQFTVCTNRSHASSVQPVDAGSGKPACSLSLGVVPKILPLSTSLQNLSPRNATDLPKDTIGDGRRWSFDKPGEEEKAAIAAALEKSGPMVPDDDASLGPTVHAFSSSTSELESQGKKQKRSFFSHGKGGSEGSRPSPSKEESEQATPAAEERQRGWFGSKDLHSKPSLVMSPKLESCTDPHPPQPHSGPILKPISLVSQLHHTNPFCHSEAASPNMPSCNPFFPVLKCNPFYEDLLTAEPQKPSLPPLPYLSSCRPLVAQLLMQAKNADPSLTYPTITGRDSTAGFGAKSHVMAFMKILPSGPGEEDKPSSKKPPNPFMSADSDWDESFQVFASERLQTPSELASGQTQQNTPRTLPRFNDKGMIALGTNADQTCDMNEASHHQPPASGMDLTRCTEAIRLVTNANMYLDTFLDTIPEHGSFEYNTLLATLDSSSELDGRPESHHAGTTTDTSILSHSIVRRNSPVKLQSSSPDPISSGLGSSAEDDFHSCISSYSASEKFSGSSSDDTEVQTFDFPHEQHGSATTPDVFLSSTHPSVHIVTSTPGVCQQSSNSLFESTKVKMQDVSREPPVPLLLCDDFPNTSSVSPNKDSDLTVLDQSGSSRLLSLYVSADSQHYQSCPSHPSSEGSSTTDSTSELTSTLCSATSVLCTELSEVLAPTGVVLGLGGSEDSSGQSREGIEEPDPREESRTAEDRTATPQPIFSVQSDVKMMPPTDISLDSKPNLGKDIAPRGDMFLPCSMRQRSKSEGMLTTHFDDRLLLPSLSSDSCSLQESSSMQHGLPSLTSFVPSPVAKRRSFPLAPHSLLSLSNASATSAPGMAISAMPALTNLKAKPQEAQQRAAYQQNSPHPVKPLNTATPGDERRSESRSVLASGLEKLKSTIHPGRSSQLSEHETEKKKTEGAGLYYHLTHSELVALLVQREAELERQKMAFHQQKALLAKREVELKKLKPQVRDLEDYIDTLLVRIMEQKPTLLQVGSKLK